MRKFQLIGYLTAKKKIKSKDTKGAYVKLHRYNSIDANKI